MSSIQPCHLGCHCRRCAVVGWLRACCILQRISLRTLQKQRRSQLNNRALYGVVADLVCNNLPRAFANRASKCNERAAFGYMARHGYIAPHAWTPPHRLARLGDSVQIVPLGAALTNCTLGYVACLACNGIHHAHAFDWFSLSMSADCALLPCPLRALWLTCRVCTTLACACRSVPPEVGHAAIFTEVFIAQQCGEGGEGHGTACVCAGTRIALFHPLV